MMSAGLHAGRATAGEVVVGRETFQQDAMAFEERDRQVGDVRRPLDACPVDAQRLNEAAINGVACAVQMEQFQRKDVDVLPAACSEWTLHKVGYGGGGGHAHGQALTLER